MKLFFLACLSCHFINAANKAVDHYVDIPCSLHFKGEVIAHKTLNPLNPNAKTNELINLVKENKFERELDITLSQGVFYQDYFPIAKGLTEFSYSRLSKKYFDTPTFQYKKAKVQVENLEIELNGQDPAILHDLDALEKEGFEKGARRAFVTVKSLTSVTNSYLKKKGYTKQEVSYQAIFSKELKDSPVLSKELFQNIKEDEEPTMPYIPHMLGLVIRGENGEVFGGILAEERAEQSLLYIDCLYVDEELRGKGRLGSSLMEAAERYAKSKGLKHIFLETAEFQAPVFYEKMGFKRVMTLEKYLIHKNGAYQQYYTYHKPLEK